MAGSADWSDLDSYRIFGRHLAPLPATAIEVKRVAGHLSEAGYEVRTLVGDAATQGSLEDALDRVGILHLATHGFRAHPQRPFEAALALAVPSGAESSEDGVLTLDELIRTWGGRLGQCELVTLSACDTNVGARVGESLVPLYWGFFHAGAKRCLVSLWKVDGRATLLFMDRFYANLCGSFVQPRSVAAQAFKAGQAMPVAAALQETRYWLAHNSPAANRELLNKLQATGASALRSTDDTFPRHGAAPKILSEEDFFDFSHPRYWSAFVLYGG